MEKIDDSNKILNIVTSVVYHLNPVNLHNMTQKLVVLRISDVKLLAQITDIIYNRATTRYNYTHIYAQMCERMIHDSTFNTLTTDPKTTFQKVLIQKCSDVFYTLKTYQQKLDNLKENIIKHHNQEPENFIAALNNFQYDFYKKSISNCRFIGELFRRSAVPKKFIMACITDLCNENDELHMHCLCILLQLAGPLLSKTYDLKDSVNKLLLFKEKTSLNNFNMSSTLKYLIKQIQISVELTKPVKKMENNYLGFYDQSKRSYTSKSYEIIAAWIFDECYDILFNFVIVNHNIINEDMNLLNGMAKKKKIDLLPMTNTWIRFDPVSFVVSMILVALPEKKNIRNYTGKLLDNLVEETVLSNCSIQLGFDKVLNDRDIKKEIPNLSNLVSDITSQLTL